MLKNKFEERVFKELKKSGVIVHYESEKIPYIFGGHYTPDFVVQTNLGKIYIETKGYLRPEHKRVMVATKKTNPHLDIRIVFYAKKLKDIKWAEKYGFKWAIGSVPEEWLL